MLSIHGAHLRRPRFGQAGSPGGRVTASGPSPTRLGSARIIRIYMSFDYNQDLSRVRRVARIPGVAVNSAAGLEDPSYFENARLKGDRIAYGMIDAALESSSVTVVCIDRYTSGSRFVAYQVERTLDLGHGIVGVHVAHLPDALGKVDTRGSAPCQIKMAGFKVYDYFGAKDLAAHVIGAAERAGL